MLGCHFFGLFEVSPRILREAAVTKQGQLFLVLAAPGQGGAWGHPATPALPGGKHVRNPLENGLKNTCNQGRVQALSVSSS